MGNGHENKPHLLRVSTVRGEPYVVAGRMLTPLARVVALGKAQGTVAPHSISGWGAGFALISPQAVLEETDEGMRRVAINDATTSALLGMCSAALVIAVLCTVLRWLAGRRRMSGGCS